MSPSNTRLEMMEVWGRPHEGAAAQETRGVGGNPGELPGSGDMQTGPGGRAWFQPPVVEERAFLAPHDLPPGASPQALTPGPRPLTPQWLPRPPLRVAWASLCARRTPGAKVSGGSKPSPVVPSTCWHQRQMYVCRFQRLSWSTSQGPAWARPLSPGGCGRGRGSGGQGEQQWGWRGATLAHSGEQHPAPLLCPSSRGAWCPRSALSVPWAPGTC